MRRQVHPVDPVTDLAGEAALRSALLALAARLDSVAVDLARAAFDVRCEWEGPHRGRFDAEQARRNAHVAAVIADCRRTAAQ